MKHTLLNINIKDYNETKFFTMTKMKPIPKIED